MPNINLDEEKAHYVAATCIVVKDGKFLIAKRSDKERHWPNRWTVPGGKLERSEYSNKEKDTPAGQWYNVFENLIRREVMEEVGLKIKDIRYLTSLAFERKDGIPSIVISLYADHHEGNVKLSDELSDHRWVTLEEAKDYDLIEGIYEEMQMLDKILKGEKAGEWEK
jgi:8-oxo-dGTP pyrophosphatase MutT (NUDIX family)